jgi:hypothetical protein
MPGEGHVCLATLRRQATRSADLASLQSPNRWRAGIASLMVRDTLSEREILAIVPAGRGRRSAPSGDCRWPPLSNPLRALR